MSNPETVRVLILPDEVDPKDLYVVFNFAEGHYYQLEAKTMKLRKVELFTPITVDWGGMPAQHAVEAWVVVDEQP